MIHTKHRKNTKFQGIKGNLAQLELPLDGMLPEQILNHYDDDRIEVDKPAGKPTFRGLVEPKPFIAKHHRIATIGSVFTKNIAGYLNKKGFITGEDAAFVDDDFYNTFVLREAFEAAFEVGFDSPNWFSEASETPRDCSSKAIVYNRNYISTLLAESDVFVITLGLAEIWCDTKDEIVFPSGLSIDEFDKDRHGFRLSTVEENRKNLERIYTLIRSNRPDARIIFTLSPDSLLTSFRPDELADADKASTSVLRAAIDQLLQALENDHRLFYHPSYEIVIDYFADDPSDDGLNIKDEVSDFVMDHFSNSFLLG